jgi:predicted Fe-Mo cluster-binding NifX family protein
MMICIPTKDDQGLDSKINDHFGSAPYYALADTENDEVEIVLNRGHRHRQGACNPAGALGGYKIDAVVCAGMGRGAFSSLAGAGIKVLLSDKKTVRDVLAAAREGLLRELSADEICPGHGAGHGGGHGVGHGRGRGSGRGMGRQKEQGRHGRKS